MATSNVYIVGVVNRHFIVAAKGIVYVCPFKPNHHDAECLSADYREPVGSIVQHWKSLCRGKRFPYGHWWNRRKTLDMAVHAAYLWAVVQTPDVSFQDAVLKAANSLNTIKEVTDGE